MRPQNPYDIYKKNSITSKAPVKEGNDVYYWKHIFPKAYKHMIYGEKWNEEHTRAICIEGDVAHSKSPGGRDIYPCTCGCSVFNPRKLGNDVVGYEMVYNCAQCGNMCRMWIIDENGNQITRVEDY